MKQLSVLSYYTATEGTYVSVKPTHDTVLRLQPLHEQLQALGFEGLHPLCNLHITVIHSKDDLDISEGDPYLRFDLAADRVFSITPRQGTWWPGHDDTGYVVCKVDSDELHALHNRFLAAGLTTSFPEYEPHITWVENALDDHTEDELQAAADLITHFMFDLDAPLEFTAVRIEDCN